MARLRGSTWTADARKHGGRRVAGFATKARAERYESECAVAAEQGLAVPLPERATGAGLDPSLGDSLRDASCATWGGCKSRARHELYVQDFGASLVHGLSTPVRAVTDAHLLTWAAQLEARGNSAATVNRKLTAVSAVLDYAYKAQWVGRKPVIPWRRAEGGRIVVLSDAQSEHFRQCLPPIYGDFMVFLLETGMRHEEALKFTPGDIRYNEGVHGNLHPMGVDLPAEITKAGKERFVPLTSKAERVMRPYLHSAAKFRSLNSSVWGAVIDADQFTEAFR